MTGSGVQLRWGGATDVGQLRNVNQDSMLVGPRLFVVADGMGGHQGGEVASALAIEAFARRASGTTVHDLVGAVEDANDVVYARSSQDPSLSGMGTTFVAIAVVADQGEELLAVVNVGDSRAYRLSGGRLEQISEDHSLVAELVRDGRISEQEAAVHPQRNIVTRALGIDSRRPGRRLRGAPVRRRPLPAVLRRAHERGRRGRDRLRAADHRGPRRRGAGAGPTGERTRRPRQHHDRHRRRRRRCRRGAAGIGCDLRPRIRLRPRGGHPDPPRPARRRPGRCRS